MSDPNTTEKMNNPEWVSDVEWDQLSAEERDILDPGSREEKTNA